jgi:cytochrome c553
MKKITVLSIVVATLLFTGCDDKTKKEMSEATAAVTESVKEKTAEVADIAVEKTKEVATTLKEKAVEATENTVEATKEIVSTVADKATDIKDSAVEKATEVTQAVEETASNVVAKETNGDANVGKAVYAKCAGCHGIDGKTKALGKSGIVAGQSSTDLVAALVEYKAGTRNVAGMGMLMKGQVASLSDAEIEAVATYMSTL